MDPVLQTTISFLVALIASFWAHPRILKLAKLKEITDNPNARKLQQSPVPILGGIAVMFGILAGLLIASAFGKVDHLTAVLISASLMVYIGSLDDILGLSPVARLIIESLMALLLILSGNFIINNFHGLLGIYSIPVWVAIPLTMLTIVGVINAINLIDGVDGLCSGFCIVACLLFARILSEVGDWQWTVLALVCAGALVPFFLHNVFGKESHIYIGDGGTLLMGTILSAFVIEILHNESPACRFVEINTPDMSLIALVLSILAVPVGDCLRVMGWRIIKGESPFSADKTHLHHLFIEAKFGHIVTALTIIIFNLLVVLAWYVSYRLGATQSLQVLIVIVMGCLMTGGFYSWITFNRKRGTRLYRHFCWLGVRAHFKQTSLWIVLQKMIDAGAGEGTRTLTHKGTRS